MSLWDRVRALLERLGDLATDAFSDDDTEDQP